MYTSFIEVKSLCLAAIQISVFIVGDNRHNEIAGSGVTNDCRHDKCRKATQGKHTVTFKYVPSLKQVKKNLSFIKTYKSNQETARVKWMLKQVKFYTKNR